MNHVGCRANIATFAVPLARCRGRRWFRARSFFHCRAFPSVRTPARPVRVVRGGICDGVDLCLALLAVLVLRVLIMPVAVAMMPWIDRRVAVRGLACNYVVRRGFVLLAALDLGMLVRARVRLSADS